MFFFFFPVIGLAVASRFHLSEISARVVKLDTHYKLVSCDSCISFPRLFWSELHANCGLKMSVDLYYLWLESKLQSPKADCKVEIIQMADGGYFNG